MYNIIMSHSTTTNRKGKGKQRSYYYCVETSDYLMIVKGHLQLGKAISGLMADGSDNFDITEYYQLSDVKVDFPTFTLKDLNVDIRK